MCRIFPLFVPSGSACGCDDAIPPAGSDSLERGESYSGKVLRPSKGEVRKLERVVAPIKW